MKGRIRAVVWDFDGVLLDSEVLHMEAEFETFRTFGFEIPVSVAKEYFGIKLEDYFGDVVRRFKPGFSAEEMIRKHYDTLLHYYRNVFPLAPHARSVLEELEGRYAMALATSRERELAQLALQRHGLEHFFDALIFGEDVSAGKPDPEPFVRACGILGVEPREAVAVEDAEAGFTSARRAGMRVIARRAAHNRELDFSAAHCIIEDLREIPLQIECMAGYDRGGAAAH
jgi:HAD superfamily hydrolase (TIGR01509 family)